MIGRSIAHYTVVEKLGQGGMGEVYKARDTHLDRFVALKVLPPGKVADPERKQRFVLEAKAASALNHPNIVHVYDIDTTDSVDYIAMEYVQGRTLDRLIQRKGMRVAEVLGYASQIADALAKAHGAGIVHRDLKPANIMVTDEGIVKVLDFGLAKLTEPSDADGAADETATMDARQHLTEKGVILGTIAYMSPEQAQGLPVDPRSDIFSFGAVLYEMLVGAQPFAATSKAMTLASILQQEPKPIREIAPEVPDEVEKLVVRCMRKDPRRRWQNMSDLKVVLQDLKEESESGRLLASPSTAGAAVPAVRRPRFRHLLLVGVSALSVVLVAGTLFLWRYFRKPGSTPEPELTRLTFDSGATLSSTISADGKFIAFASDRSGRGDLDIYVQHIAGTQPRALTQDEADDRSPSFSPDGSQVAFQSDRGGGGIYVIETNAQPGAERRIADGGTNPRFSPDGSVILFMDSENRMVLVPPGGGPVQLFQPGFRVTPSAAIGPVAVWSPDGKHILFDGGRSSDDKWGWWITPVNGGAPIAAARGCSWPDTGSGYVPYAWDGNQIVFSLGNSVTGINLFSCGISLPAMNLTCSLQRLTSGPGAKTSAAVSADGRIVFTNAKGVMAIWSYTLDPKLGTVTGEPAPLVSNEMGKRQPVLSADASQLAYMAYGSPTQMEIRVRDIHSGREWVAAQGRGRPALPRLNADGSVLAYTERVAGKSKGFVGPSQGAAAREVCVDCLIAAISADGNSGIIQTRKELAQQNFKTGARTPVLSSSADIEDVSLSADEKWLAILTRKADGVPGLYAVPFGDKAVAEREWIRVLEEPGLVSPVWSADGKIIYYFSDKDGKVCIYGQHVDPATKKPVGPPFSVRHEHRAAYSTTSPPAWRTLSTARNKLVCIVMEINANIYSTQLPRE